MRESSDHDESLESRRERRLWAGFAVALAAVLFWIATSNAVYDITSPGWLSFHVLLRKAYSIAAFALVGFSTDNAFGTRTRAGLRAALLVGAYSALIELSQALLGSTEGPVWEAFDVLCGALGGWLGAIGARITRSRRRR